MTRRRGFTLIELLAVLSIIGVLAVVVIPQLLRSTGTARGSALQERVRSVQVAYTAANAPDAEALAAGDGVVPEAFAGSLNPGHFVGEAGVRLSVVGTGRDVWLRLEAHSPEGRIALEAFGRRSGASNLQSGSIALVPLSPEAMELVEQINAANAATAVSATAGGSTDGTASGTRSSGGSSQSASGSVAGGDATSGATLVPGGDRSTDDDSKEQAVPCSPTLPAPVYNRCLSATASGWFRR